MELNFGNDSTPESEKLKINQQFAAKYQKRKERQELEKCKILFKKLAGRSLACSSTSVFFLGV